MESEINRLGFEAWADNLIVNAIENMRGSNLPHYYFDKDDIVVSVRTEGKEMTALVRAYVNNIGWQTHEQVIKIK